MKKKRFQKMYIDQEGEVVWARTLKELRVKAGGGRISKAYNDGTDGKTYHTGYVVGCRWFDEFTPTRKEQ